MRQKTGAGTLKHKAKGSFASIVTLDTKMFRDYYAILHITEDADQEAIKRAYRRQAMEHHPDRNPGDMDAEARFREVNEAYEILCDPRSRASYDYKRSGSGYAGGAPFGGGGWNLHHAAHGWMPRGADMRLDLLLTRDEARRGLDLELEIPVRRDCRYCRGAGAIDLGHVRVCGKCHGRGEIIYIQGSFRVRTSCPDCGGHGYVSREICPECGGRGSFEDMRRVGIRIPPGVRNGDRLVVEGQGDPGGSTPGDLHLFLHVSDMGRRNRMFDSEEYLELLLRRFMGGW